MREIGKNQGFQLQRIFAAWNANNINVLVKNEKSAGTDQINVGFANKNSFIRIIPVS